MVGIIIRLLLVFGVITVFYIAVVAYQRWDTRRVLEQEHLAGADNSLSREDYVARGLARQERSFNRRALLYVVFLMPLAVGTILAGLALIS